jgi:isopentenyl diphosphate isomerase/L-lactate dehydrogenase-like FMN-dependent dehydrogenase
MQRAHEAGVRGLIATLDWSFSVGRDGGSPEIPERLDLRAQMRMAPQVIRRPQWVLQFVRAGLPDMTAPNLAPPGGDAPLFFGAYYEWMNTPPPSWEDVTWMSKEWAQLSGTPFMLKGVCRIDDALRAVDAGVSAISVSNHGGNNLDGTPAVIRVLHPIASRVGHDIEVVMDSGIRRGSDVVKALALGARAVMIGRASLFGLAANGQAGVENVLDLMRMGIDSTLRGLGKASIEELTPGDLLIPDGFHRVLGAP